MATLDDKLLGEKTHYYCSSSSDEDDDDNDLNRYDREISVQSRIKWEGTSCNTGPKGVIEDFQRYKKFANERRQNREKARLERMKKSALICQLSNEKSNVNETSLEQKIDQELDNLDDNDPFINEYIAKRMKEMLDRYQQKELSTKFGELRYLNNGDDFLNCIDDVKLKDVLIVTHIFNRKIIECNRMNSCLAKLAAKYPGVMFCSIEATSIRMSREFTKYGVPALLIYKNGELIGNFVGLADEFGTEFDENDVEDFFVENNILISNQLISSISVNSNLSRIHQK
ncbi:hypothetical protein NH340_JMT08684 [Sarcoptes scabiei]|nr:hypothetical protein NH340_JMT08684 [Sarcoptes scabiei]